MAQHWIARRPGPPSTWELVDAEAPAPAAGEVTIRVRAAGINPADAKHVAREGRHDWPVLIGYEISGEITAVGPGTDIATGSVAVGDEVVAFRIQGGYASEVTVDAAAVLRKPSTLTHPEAANLLLAGTTAAEMLAVIAAAPGELIVLHGASGAVGVSVLQQAAARGIRVIGTASESSSDRVRGYGGVPVAYGPGLTERVRAAAGDTPVVAALDAIGTAEALDASLELVADRGRIVTIVDATRAEAEGIRWIAGALPESARFRAAVRGEVIALAEAGLLEVPVAQTFPLADAVVAHDVLATGHPGGKLALVP